MMGGKSPEEIIEEFNQPCTCGQKGTGRCPDMDEWLRNALASAIAWVAEEAMPELEDIRRCDCEENRAIRDRNRSYMRYKRNLAILANKIIEEK